MEHLMNVYASKAAKGSIAEFLGFCEVAADEANYRLTEGLWLVSVAGSSSILRQQWLHKQSQRQQQWQQQWRLMMPQEEFKLHQPQLVMRHGSLHACQQLAQ